MQIFAPKYHVFLNKIANLRITITNHVMVLLSAHIISPTELCWPPSCVIVFQDEFLYIFVKSWEEVKSDWAGAVGATNY